MSQAKNCLSYGASSTEFYGTAAEGNEPREKHHWPSRSLPPWLSPVVFPFDLVVGDVEHHSVAGASPQPSRKAW